MRRFVRAAALVGGVLLPLAPLAMVPASAQIALSEQEFYKLRLLAADNPEALQTINRAVEELPADVEALIVAFQQELLRDREVSDYFHARFGATIDTRADFSQRLADGIIAQTDVIIDGIFRLPLEDQEAYLAFVKLTFEELARTSPQTCLDLVEGNMSTVDYMRIDYLGFRALGADGLPALLDLYREAVYAEVAGQTPVTSFSDRQLENGQSALEEAVLELFEGSPVAERVGAAEDIDDIVPADLCALTTIVFDGFEQLEQPERSWALRAVLLDSGF